MAQWTGCIAGALTPAEYRMLLEAAGLTAVTLQETHRVHPHAGSAIIRAAKPGTAGCCGPAEQAACCEPAAKAECCGSSAVARGGCAC